MERDKRTQMVVKKAELVRAYANGELHHASEIIALQNELQVQQNRTWFRNSESRYYLIHPDGRLQKGKIYRLEGDSLYSSLGTFSKEQRAQFYEIEDVFLSYFEHLNEKESECNAE
ncbi:hypothetical protein CN918_29565 [Priestia megaterium]|nr:hypothetical protein CN918_29565 [Priestia megaterium]